MMTSAPAMPAVDGCVALAAGEFAGVGREAARRDDADLGDAERCQHVPGGARHARVLHVADDGHLEAVELLLRLQDGERVEQPLRGMRDVRFARRQHAGVRLHVRGDDSRHARLGIADHEHVHVAGFERVDGVEHALALHARRELHLEIDHVGAEPLGRELERHARARRRLGEHVGHGDAGEALACAPAARPRVSRISARA